MVGPLTSLVLAGLAALLPSPLPVNPLVARLLDYLATVNGLLTLFNLLPGLPLDGGRILRAAIWKLSDNFFSATRIAARVGRGIACLLVVGGLALGLVGGSLISDFWLAIIGWFLGNGARAAYRQAVIEHSLQGLTVGDLVQTEVLAVSPTVRLRDLVERVMLRHGLPAYPVVFGGRLIGLIGVGEVRAVPVERWRTHTVGPAMVRPDGMTALSPADEAAAALARLGDAPFDLVPVVDGGRPVGVLGRERLLNVVNLRDRLGADLHRADQLERRAA